MVSVRSLTVKIFVVLEISVTVTQLSVVDCHLSTVPVNPDKVRVLVFVPVHTEAGSAIVPPTETG